MMLQQESLRDWKKTIGLICVKGDPEKICFNYGYDDSRSEVLYYVQRRRILKAFSRDYSIKASY